MKRKSIVITAVILCVSVLLFSKEVPSHFVFLRREARPTVIIDAGHGGFDGGAVGIQGSEEKVLNLEISQKLRDLLMLLGVETKMIREEDKAVNSEDAGSIREKKVSDIKTRVKIIESCENARLISIHLNHFSQASCHGAQVFYSQTESSKALAEAVQNNLKLGLDKSNKRVPMLAGKNIYLLNNISCPAILVECGFLSNPIEEKKLGDYDYQTKIALCIACGYINAEQNL